MREWLITREAKFLDEALGNERQETAAGFWERAREFFRQSGFEAEEVLTDNGSCYRSHVFNTVLGSAAE